MEKALEILKRLNEVGAISVSEKISSEAIAELEEAMKPKTCENLCIEFMNEWEKCGKLPDSEADLSRLDNVFNKMYEHIFGKVENPKDNA